MGSSGRLITSSDILNGTILGADVANDTLTATQIAADAVGASELANNAVDTAAIVAQAVTQVVSTKATTVNPATTATTVGGAATLPECSQTLVTTGGDVLVLFSGQFYHPTAGSDIHVDLYVDGAFYTDRVVRIPASGNNINTVALTEWLSAAVVPAGPHPILVRFWCSTAGTTTNNGVERNLTLVEFKR